VAEEERGHVCLPACRRNAHVAFEGRRAVDAAEGEAARVSWCYGRDRDGEQGFESVDAALAWLRATKPDVFRTGFGALGHDGRSVQYGTDYHYAVISW
jgi:hypothetical protein